MILHAPLDSVANPSTARGSIKIDQLEGTAILRRTRKHSGASISNVSRTLAALQGQGIEMRTECTAGGWHLDVVREASLAERRSKNILEIPHAHGSRLT